MGSLLSTPEERIAVAAIKSNERIAIAAIESKERMAQLNRVSELDGIDISFI